MQFEHIKELNAEIFDKSVSGTSSHKKRSSY